MHQTLINWDGAAPFCHVVGDLTCFFYLSFSSSLSEIRTGCSLTGTAYHSLLRTSCPLRRPSIRRCPPGFLFECISFSSALEVCMPPEYLPAMQRRRSAAGAALQINLRTPVSSHFLWICASFHRMYCSLKTTQGRTVRTGDY